MAVNETNNKGDKKKRWAEVWVGLQLTSGRVAGHQWTTMNSVVRGSHLGFLKKVIKGSQSEWK